MNAAELTSRWTSFRAKSRILRARQAAPRSGGIDVSPELRPEAKKRHSDPLVKLGPQPGGGSDMEPGAREAGAAWSTSQLKVFVAEGNIPAKEDCSTDMDAAAELAGWLKLSREAYEARGIEADDEEIRRTALACQFEHRSGVCRECVRCSGFSVSGFRLCVRLKPTWRAEMEGSLCRTPLCKESALRHRVP